MGTSNALVTYDGNVESLAQHLVKSGLFPSDRDISKAITKITLGKTLGLDPMTAMSNLIVVQGKLSMSAHLMARLIKTSGRYHYTVDEWTDKICTITLYEKMEESQGKWTWLKHNPVSGRIDEFKHLMRNPTWQQYPKNMLFARTISNIARMLCPDVFGGSVYLPDEIPDGGCQVNGETLEVVEEANSNVIDVNVEIESDDPLAQRLKKNGLSLKWAASTLRVANLDFSKLTEQQRKRLNDSIEVYEEVNLVEGNS